MAIYITLFVIFVIYLQTMMPSQAFHDSGELQTVTQTLSVAHPTGFPTYIILGKILTFLIPIGGLAWKVNFLSVIYSVLTLYFLSLFLFKLTKNSLWSVIGVLFLAFIYPFWNWAGMADTHTLNRMFLALLILLFFYLSKNWNIKNLLFFSFVFGLGLGNHLLLVYSIPGFLIWYLMLMVTRKIQFNIYQIIAGIIYFSLGLCVYLFLPLSERYGTPYFLNYSISSWGGFIRHISGADFQGFMYQGGLQAVLRNIVGGLFELYDYFGLIGILMGFGGVIYGLFNYRIVVLSLGTMFFSFLFFSTNYPTSDPTRYYLSYITIYSLFIGIGSYGIFALTKEALSFDNQVKKMVLTAIFILLCFIPIVMIQKNYKLLDKSKDYYAEEYSRSIFQNIELNSVIISWWNYTTPLWYRKYVLNERSDVLIINTGQGEWKDYVNKYINTRQVYLVENEQKIGESYKIIPYGYIYKVLPK